MNLEYREIFDSLSAPKLWERSDAAFWDDAHISKQMLKAHLAPDVDAASRKAETIEKSIKWLNSMMKPGCRILDLGCGPGLYSKELSGMGYDVTGVDCSQRSIDYAKQQDSKSRYLCMDYLDFSEENTYDVILMIYCDYAALTLPERKVILQKIHRALKRGGIFIFDVFTKKGSAKNICSTRWELCPVGGFFYPSEYALLETSYFYESDTVRADRYVVLTPNKIIDHIIWDTVYSKDSLLEEVSTLKFTLISAFDDICGTPFTGEADTLCFMLKK